MLTVPNSAVIDSGTRRIVLVQLAEGRFEPREVKLGARSDTYVEVLDGVKDGEPVVVAANFLIDAESNLKAAIGGFGTPGDRPRRRRPRRGQHGRRIDRPQRHASIGDRRQGGHAVGHRARPGRRRSSGRR